jgi:hypothetical protein|tara:strand:- start:312 stop:569 length:258 start_codon:yes stop_codon:yes gene_type:complete
MTIKNIFDSIINFDLMNVVYFVGGIIVYLFLPLGCVWFGGMILKDVLIDKQPQDRDLFAKIFMVISGTFVTFVIPVFLVRQLWFN